MKYLFVIISCCISLGAIAGGGWTKKQGKGYYKVQEWYIKANRHYTSTGEVDPNVTIGIYNTAFYGEYGVTDRLTATMYFPFLSYTFMNSIVNAYTGTVYSEADEYIGLGDMDISAKYRISNPASKYAFAGSLLLGLPFGTTKGGNSKVLQTGDGEFNQMLRLDLSRGVSIGSFSAYGNIYTAFNNRTKGYSDEVRYGGEVGVSALKGKIWLIYRLDVLESLRNGSVNIGASSESATIFASDTEFSSYTFEAAAYLTKKIGVSAAYGSAFRGELILAKPSYSFGVFIDIK